MARPLLAEKISRNILTDFSRTESLPGERALAEHYGCNRLTVRKALKLLGNSGMVASQPRSGHYLTELALRPAPPTMPGIVLFSMEERLRDPAHNYMIGGATHQARLSNVNLVVKELGDCAFTPLPALEALHPGVDADAYIIAGAAPHALLSGVAASGKPCVVLGKLYEEYCSSVEIACQQLLLASAHVYSQVTRHLLELGHRHFLLATSYSDGLEETHRALLSQFPNHHDYRIDLFMADLPRNERNPETLRQAARQLLDRLDGQSALIIPEGHIFALEVIVQLRQRGIAFPDDISLVVQGCETDWFLDIYNITCVYAEYRDQGAACVKEALRQLHNGRCEVGIRYTPAHLIVRASTGKAPNR